IQWRCPLSWPQVSALAATCVRFARHCCPFSRPPVSAFQKILQFLTLYGKAVRGEATSLDLDLHSQTWTIPSNPTLRLLIAATETAILAERLVASGCPYEAVQVELCGLRAVMVHLFRSQGVGESTEHLELLHASQLERIAHSCREFTNLGQKERERSQRHLEQVTGGPWGIVSYPVACSRLMEALGLLVFLSQDDDQDAAVSFLSELVQDEPGCAHLISDRYAISLVSAVLALWVLGKADLASDLLRRTALWVADRYDAGAGSGFGLAGIDADVDQEVVQLLGPPFDFLDVRREPSSLAATAILDLLARIGDSGLYAEVVNEFLAVRLCPQFFQAPDSEAQFFVEGEDVVLYPNIGFSEESPVFNDLAYADHARHELTGYRLFDLAGWPSYLSLMLLLRDRWFLCLWRALTVESERAPDRE
ncbi:MAG: hypothetical protein ACYC96_14815, partial [Fimbriimonadaceae bacterium]